MTKIYFKEVKLNPECDSLKPLCNIFPGTDAKVLKIHLTDAGEDLKLVHRHHKKSEGRVVLKNFSQKVEKLFFSLGRNYSDKILRKIFFGLRQISENSRFSVLKPAATLHMDHVWTIWYSSYFSAIFHRSLFFGKLTLFFDTVDLDISITFLMTLKNKWSKSVPSP